MNGTVTPWFYNASAMLAAGNGNSLFSATVSQYHLTTKLLDDCCWLIISWPKGGRIAFRLAYSPNDPLSIEKINQTSNGVEIIIESHIGIYKVNLLFSDEDFPVVRCTTVLTPARPLLIPFWPRDIVVLPVANSDSLPQGRIHTAQAGTRSGIMYFSTNKPRECSVLYLQNLTALADYNEQTETSAGNTVGGEWPEIGFALPPTLKGKPLEADNPVCLSDAIITLSEETPADEATMTRNYLDLLAAAYLVLPKPETNYQDWPKILKKGLFDLQDSPGCWSQVDGNHYFNAYVSDYDNPPEVMVQLAVLLPLLDYVEWSGETLEVMKKIKKGLPPFYNTKLQTLMRWHPKAEYQLKGDEEQKQPLVMDSWYLHHPLLNLSRLALKGDEPAKQLFLESLGFAVKVAHHFRYQWPVFYKMDTLEVVKAETKPGEGGEKDVPGLYAHVMLQAWELTGEKKYLAEAEHAALKLRGLGFKLFYQANNTSFSAGALIRLYKITQKEVYRDLSYLCIANLLNNVHLWDCNYGYGKNFPSFFALFPLTDAPYTAVYEEMEVFCACHDFLKHAEGIEILPSVNLLLTEYIRYLVDRAAFYYPTMLPGEMLAENIKTGELDPNLWIALEDMHDGWEKCGAVGQEVYGAGNAFGILPRHYLIVPDEDFLIYIDYPTTKVNARRHQSISFNVLGDKRMKCRLVIAAKADGKLPRINVATGEEGVLKGEKIIAGLAYTIAGGQSVKIHWSR
ncbi:MAG TPA: hypothetical protein VIM77_06975 [Mucilaginibacter sp.]